jgi:succinate-acetate transporter protein
MSLLGKKYVWNSEVLKTKYKKYTTTFAWLAIIGAVLALGFTKYVSTNATLISYSVYVGFICWAVAIYYAIAQSKIKATDKQLKIVANQRGGDT